MTKEVTNVSNFPIIIEHRRGSGFGRDDFSVMLKDCVDTLGTSYDVEFPKFVVNELDKQQSAETTTSAAYPMKNSPFNITHQNIYFSVKTAPNATKHVVSVLTTTDFHDQTFSSQQDHLLRNRMGLVIFVWAILTFHRATLAGFKSLFKIFK
jgi:hypothetical protein